MTNNDDPDSILFYRLGLLLYRISEQQDYDTIGNSNTVYNIKNPLKVYRTLLETIADDTLISIFDDLRRAMKTLMVESQQTRNNNDDDGTLSYDADIGAAVRSLAGLICCCSRSLSSSNSHQSRRRRHLCVIMYNEDWIAILAALYDRFIVTQHRRTVSSSSSHIIIEENKNKSAVLSCLSRLLLDGLIENNATNTTITIEESLLEAIRSMEQESVDCLRDLQQWQDTNEPFRRSLETSLQTINTKCDDDDVDDDGDNRNDDEIERAQQREYILSMLESARAPPSSSTITSNNKTIHQPTAATSSSVLSSSAPYVNSSKQPHSELDRRLLTVKSILPHFGEGFLEVALGLHHGDVEATVATLLNHPGDDDDDNNNGSYPTALRVLDPNLPRRKREFQMYRSVEEEEANAEQARRDVKERLALEEKQKKEQYEALMYVSSSQQVADEEETTTSINDSSNITQHHQQQFKSEYDDDYDDQYDEIDIKLGATDDGFTIDNDGVTYEHIKLYNQVLREDESDAAFWEQNRNMNRNQGGKRRGQGSNNQPSSRSNSPKHNHSNTNDKKYRGPNKIKGGKIVDKDGKIVRKPGKRYSKINGGNATTNQSQSDKDNSNDKKFDNANTSTTNTNKKKTTTTTKPRTKPKSDNRVNRQRDRKQTKQGTFGVQ